MLEQYTALRERGVEVALTIGPWTHVELATRAARVTMPETLDWLAEHLAGTGRRRRPAPVRIFVTGAEQWRDLPDWPPAGGVRTLFLQPGGRLAEQPPAASAGPSGFRYHPADPTPAVGGRVINPALAGRRDNRVLERRADVVTFTGDVLAEPVEVTGIPVVELVHRTDNPHADLFIRLCEVGADGRSVNLADGFRRPDPATTDDLVRIELDAIAHRFAAGSRIRLQVSGGAHGRYARNLGTAQDPATGQAMAGSRRTIQHGAGGSSRLLLPCPD